MQANRLVVTPTQAKVLSALSQGPLSYYDLMAKVEARESTINKAVLILLDLGKIAEVQIGQIVGLKLNESEDDHLARVIKKMVLADRKSERGGTGTMTTAHILKLIFHYSQRRHKICCASQATMAKELGIETRTLRRHIRRLETLGLIEDTTPKLRNWPHSHKVTADGLSAIETCYISALDARIPQSQRA